MNQVIRAELISIGNELLSGITVNTNAAWLGDKLTNLGVAVQWVTVIRDTPEDINTSLHTAGNRADLIISTGGLGPTPDDLTRHALCLFFNTELILHTPTYEKIKTIFARRKLKMPEINRLQAMIPRCATLITNPLGAAPGLELEKDDKIFYFLPGVPMEMKRMMEDDILERIKKRFTIRHTSRHLFRTTGLPESGVYEKIADILTEYPDIQVAFLPKTSGIDIRLNNSVSGPETESEFPQCTAKIKSRLEKYIFSEGEEGLAEVIGRILTEKKLILAVAESFTGGLVSDWITDVAGSSGYFAGAVNTYANNSKIDLLHVPAHTIEKYGAVSEQTALDMVRGVRQLFNTDCAISTTGIAGPGGGTVNKPVGLSFIAALHRDEVRVKQFHFGQNRRMIKERGAAAALELLRKILLQID